MAQEESAQGLDRERFNDMLLESTGVGLALVDPESLPRKQQRGTSIDGGLRQKTFPGDMIHIPPGVPHQLIVDQPYMYLLFKLDEEPLG